MTSDLEPSSPVWECVEPVTIMQYDSSDFTLPGKRGLKRKRDSCEGDSLFLALVMGDHMVRNTGGLEKVKVVPADSW